ncbi:T9SS type A sorting domain-containing protein [Formosa sp. PL04]|uniref:T9SS type A sorting domain-containing protein n=1 Tax=Formosa sp. PL04 TaxID=3081755 RepID=UPI0029815ECB|nr:T9SS type A sorting domain-containing protein [Formosa sp. PL04]MDW5289359.1 T9SS type A sorting domain-containing protein [Formosa sp. PL04]
MSYLFSTCFKTGFSLVSCFFRKTSLLFILIFSFYSLAQAQTKAFPSAYGAGAYTTGGRGGEVYHVTNLNDSGSGSFREAVKGSNRIIVFDVSGVIQLKSLVATSGSNLTIAGQTAPEGGITIDGNRIYFSNVDNVIVRHIRFKGGVDGGDDSFTATANMTNIIFDHCSFAFGADEAASWNTTDTSSSINNVTVQRSLFAESSKGAIFGGASGVNIGKISVLNNLWYNISHRFPNVNGYGGDYEVINNVVWTVKNRLIRGNGNFNLNHLSNYYDFGDQAIADKRLNMYNLQSYVPKIYTNGNKYVAKNSISPLTYSVSEMNSNNTKAWKFFLDAGGYSTGDQVPSNYFENNQFNLFGAKINVQSADAAFNDVKNDVGCNASLNADGSKSSNLDVLDIEWLSNVKKGSYTSGMSESSYSVPSISSKSRPSNYDTDKDGMADEWERNTFGDLSKNGTADSDGDGYTDLEEFLNGVDGDNTTAPTPDVEVNAGEDQIICKEVKVTLKASGASTYEWNTGEKTQSITVSPEQTTTYTVTGKDDSGNSDTDTVKVTVQDLPTVDAGADVSICEEGSIELTATGTGNFEWSTGEKTKTITVSPDKTTTYTVTATNGTCSNSDVVKVTVSPRQTINAGSDVNIDLGESTKLSVSGTGSIKWSTGETSREITVSPSQTTTYSVTVTQNGCESQDEVKVIVTIPQIEVEANAGDDQTICEGETVTLTATGGSSYVWNTGETTASIKVTPATTTTYSVEVSEGTVSATANVTVNVNALPTANAGSDQTIDQGESATLSASGGTRYKWSTGATTKNITVTPNATKTYTVEVFNDGDCSDTDQVKVTVNIPTVDANAGDDQTICEGETVTLTATGGSSYVWNTGETTASIKVTPATTTTYSVEVSEGTVSATANVTVNVNALPTANAGSDQTIDQGESATLSASGGTRYKWSTGATTKNITVTPNATKTYTVEVFNDGDCSDTDQVKVTVNIPTVDANAGDDQTICEGETVILTASGGSTYVWNTGETTASIKVTPSTTSTYSVEVSEGTVSANANVTVNVNALPTANAGSDQTIDQGESVTLSASGGTRYKWSTGATTKNITVTPNSTKTYTVEVFNDGDCSDTDQVKVTVNATKIEVEANAGDDQTICEGETVTLIATGGSSYVWNTGETTASISVSPISTTTYSVEVSEGTVSASADVTVNVNALPTANAGSDQTIDQGESVTLSASGGTRYKWSTGATTKNITVTPNATKTYTVEVFNASDCSDTDQVKVTVNATKVEVEANAGDDQTICEGETVTLTATGGSSYVWNTGETTASIKVTPSTTTTYSVEVSEGTVSASADVTVNVNALPTANAGSDQTIDQGESVTLSASGGTRYKWSTGATTKDITVTPNATKTYTVEVFNEGDCSDTDQVKVTVNATKVEVEANAGDDQTICEGETVTLTATGGSSYVWNTGETTASIKVTPSTTTTYSVEVLEGTVSASADVTVNVNALPTANAGSDQTIDQGESVTLSASGGTRYKWSTGATTKDITVTPNATKTYTVEVFNEGDCSDTDQVKVTVNIPTVDANAGDDQTICEGETVTLTATGGSSYVWNTGETTSSIKVTPSTTTTYSVEVSEGTVSASANVTVNVNALPTANAGSDQTIDQGESVTLSASGGTRYKWSTGATTKNITVTPNATKTYTVEVFNDGDCSDTDQVKVWVNIPIVEANAGDDQTICEGETVTLTATGGSSYVWNTGETTASIKVTPSTTSTYSVEVSEGTVSATANVTVNVNALPTANAGSDQTIDQGESVTLSASGGTGYKWSTGATTKNITVTPNATKTYTVEVFNDGDCSDTDQVKVTVNATKVEVEANAGDDQTICEGETVTLTATGGSSYLWNTGETTASIKVTPATTTTYSVEVSEGTVSASANVTVNVNALTTANAGSDQTIDQGESVTLSASGGTRYKWSTGATTKNITVTPNATKTYTVEVFNEGDCSDTDQVKVTVNATKVEVEANAGDDQTICEGETVTLTATGGSSYVWNTGETTASIKVTPSTTTTYSVEVSEGTVSASANVTVNVNALPGANAGSDQTIDQGESVTLSASGGTRYKWSTGATTKNITVTPNATKTYTVEVFNASDCSDTDQVIVTVNIPTVDANAGDDQTICEGETVTLTATGGSSYVWNTGETTASIKVTPATTSTYSVEVSEGTVSATANVTVNVNALPTANAGSDQTIDQGESVTLSASGGTRYKWSTGATTKNITVTPNATKTYTVEVFNNGDCSDTDQVKVIVNATKVEVIADAGSDQTICEGETVTLTASGGSSYVWSTGETTASIKVAPSTTTTYSVEVSEGTVSANANVTVNVNALPTANAGSDQTIDQGESVTLSASGGTRYKWSTGATTKNITVTPNATKTYTVEVFNEGDCSDTDQVKVTVNATKVEVEANAGDDQTICEGETVTLTATGGSSYVWNTGETTASIKVTPSTTTTYSVEVSEGTVSASANVTVNVNALPTANAGSDQTIDQGGSVTLTASGGTRYKWSTGATTKNITVTPNATKTYTVEVFNEGDCSDTDQVKVTVNATKVEVEANAGNNQTICEGETVKLTATGGSSYKWSTGERTSSIKVTPSSTTTYSVEVSEGTVSETANVTVNVNVLPSANAGDDQVIEVGETVTLSASGGSFYIWNTGETTESISVSPNETMLYTVEAFNAGGCSSKDDVMVSVEALKLDPEVDKLDFEFSIYPNPATTILNLKISGLEDATPVQIFDMSGKLLYNEVIQSDGSLMHKVLDVSRYPKGFYLLTIYRRGISITKKVVLQ